MLIIFIMERRGPITKNYLHDAYLNSPVPNTEPILQILGFEVSLQEESTIMYTSIYVEYDFQIKLSLSIVSLLVLICSTIPGASSPPPIPQPSSTLMIL